MADCNATMMCIGSATMIQIGGRLTPEGVAELAEAIEHEGVFINDKGEPLDCLEAEESIRKAAAEGRCLSLFYDYQRLGRFDEIEEACHELGLTYYRAYEGHYACIPTAVFWKPGMDEPQEWASTSDMEPVLSLSALRHLVITNRLQAEIALMEEATLFPFKLEVMPARRSAAA